MAHRTNPFLERMAESTTSDQEFVRLFSPKILDRLTEDTFAGAVHIFRSPPGGGKTTLLRAFTPAALRAFWNARRVQETNETYQRLLAAHALHEQDGPQVLGVFLSCASGYADLPPGATIAREGLFRALLDSRVVLRSLRSLALLLGYSSIEQLGDIGLEYDSLATDLRSIPAEASALELVRWAEQRERAVYVELDSVGVREHSEMPAHVRFESVLWLQSVRFVVDGKVVAPKRILMVDDLHKLRRKQRATLIEELVELRPSIPVWLAERSIALGDELLSQGLRDGRDVRQYALDDLWGSGKGHHQFSTFAQNILDRRLDMQNVIPPGSFAQYLRDQFQPDDVRVQIGKGLETFRADVERYKTNPRYTEWLAHAEGYIAQANLEALAALYAARILLARDEAKRQTSLGFPLSPEELEQRDSSQVQAAADIFVNDELGIPYYFGIDKLCTMATSNVEELLSLAAALYEGLQAKQVLRKPELVLAPQEQEKLLEEIAKRKRDFIPKSHTEGTRAQRLLDAIGSYCRERTFLPNAPYAPGVTGVRLSQTELEKLSSGPLAERGALLKRVLSECVAENLLVARTSAASTSRESGTIFYLNRTLCVHYGLPLQMGGWQDVDTKELIDWMERGRGVVQRKLREVR